MGLFDKLFGGSREERESKRIRDLAKKSQEKYGDAAGRTRALEQLREIGTPEAISALLQRFTVQAEPGISDAEERDFTLSIITSFGDKAVEPVVGFIRTQDGVAWALRCLEELVPEEQLIGILTGVLEKLALEYAREPAKKVLLINHLADLDDPRIEPAVAPFLEDPSDEVRIAAMHTLVARKASGSRAGIVDCLLNAEAPRVRVAAAGALAELGAPVEAERDQVAARLPPGYSMDKAGVVHRT